MMEKGEYEEAYVLLEKLGKEDVITSNESIKPLYESILLSRAQVGDYVEFGSYEQDAISSNGKENIEWLVLAREGNQMLVISKYALDCQQYNTSSISVTWETCSFFTGV